MTSLERKQTLNCFNKTFEFVEHLNLLIKNRDKISAGKNNRTVTRLTKTCPPVKPLNGSWTPSWTTTRHVLDRSWTSGQPLERSGQNHIKAFCDFLHVSGLQTTFWDDFILTLNGFYRRNPKTALKHI